MATIETTTDFKLLASRMATVGDPYHGSPSEILPGMYLSGYQTYNAMGSYSAFRDQLGLGLVLHCNCVYGETGERYLRADFDGSLAKECANDDGQGEEVTGSGIDNNDDDDDDFRSKPQLFSEVTALRDGCDRVSGESRKLRAGYEFLSVVEEEYEAAAQQSYAIPCRSSSAGQEETGRGGNENEEEKRRPGSNYMPDTPFPSLFVRKMDCDDAPQVDILAYFAETTALIDAVWAHGSIWKKHRSQQQPSPATVASSSAATPEVEKRKEEDEDEHGRGQNSAEDQHLQTKCGGVLIHCMAGVSRSVSVLAAYIMWKYGLSDADALKFIRSRRSIASPNEGFLTQLAIWRYICRPACHRYIQLQSGGTDGNQDVFSWADGSATALLVEQASAVSGENKGRMNLEFFAFLDSYLERLMVSDRYAAQRESMACLAPLGVTLTETLVTVGTRNIDIAMFDDVPNFFRNLCQLVWACCYRPLTNVDKSATATASTPGKTNTKAAVVTQPAHEVFLRLIAIVIEDPSDFNGHIFESVWAFLGCIKDTGTRHIVGAVPTQEVSTSSSALLDVLDVCFLAPVASPSPAEEDERGENEDLEDTEKEDLVDVAVFESFNVLPLFVVFNRQFPDLFDFVQLPALEELLGDASTKSTICTCTASFKLTGQLRLIKDFVRGAYDDVASSVLGGGGSSGTVRCCSCPIVDSYVARAFVAAEVGRLLDEGVTEQEPVRASPSETSAAREEGGAVNLSNPNQPARPVLSAAAASFWALFIDNMEYDSRLGVVWEVLVFAAAVLYHDNEAADDEDEDGSSDPDGARKKSEWLLRPPTTEGDEDSTDSVCGYTVRARTSAVTAVISSVLPLVFPELLDAQPLTADAWLNAVFVTPSKVLESKWTASPSTVVAEHRRRMGATRFSTAASQRTLIAALAHFLRPSEN